MCLNCHSDIQARYYLALILATAKFVLKARKNVLKKLSSNVTKGYLTIGYLQPFAFSIQNIQQFSSLSPEQRTGNIREPERRKCCDVYAGIEAEKSRRRTVKC